MLSTFAYVANHPLNRRRPVRALARLAAWQLRSRLAGEVEVAWIGGARLVARRGMTGATGNIYCGLHEFADMALVLHLLNPGDVFVDAGANVGSYSILAAKLRGATVQAFEPDPGTAASLRRNIAANAIESLVTVHETALGEVPGVARFTIGLDTMNRIAGDGEAAQEVPIRPLDAFSLQPTFMKFDLEGFEGPAFRGAEQTLAQPSLIALITELADEVVTSLLGRHGFVRREYDPLTRRFDETPAMANALFVRDLEACQARVAAAPRITVNGVTF
jgi:FkbM family methyltransferase